MKKICFVFVLFSLLSGCAFVHVHKMDIEQGNIIDPEKVQRLHPGMPVSQVINIMGTPILTNTFSSNRIDYVYTFKPGYGTMSERYITLIFRNGVLQSISKY